MAATHFFQVQRLHLQKMTRKKTQLRNQSIHNLVRMTNKVVCELFLIYIIQQFRRVFPSACHMSCVMTGL